MPPYTGMKAGGNPGPGHGGFRPQAACDFEFAPIALEDRAQLLGGPTEFAQFFADDVFGALLFGLAQFVATGMLAIGSLHGVEEFRAKFVAAQNPATPNFLIHLVVVFPTAQFHAFAEFFSSCRAVFGDARFAQDAIDAQPTRTFGAGFEVCRVAAPGIIAYLMAALEQLGAHGVEMDVVANGAQVAGSAAINDEGLVTSAEEVAEVTVAAIETGGCRCSRAISCRQRGWRAGFR